MTDNFSCPRCGSTNTYDAYGDDIYVCQDCNHEFKVIIKEVIKRN